jgi:hypothetical protein
VGYVNLFKHNDIFITCHDDDDGGGGDCYKISNEDGNGLSYLKVENMLK